MGRHRGSGLGGGHDEREQTLNQILVQMDGFESNTNIIVIAATNRPDILDPALLRPGRFDRKVTMDLPDIAGRKAILKVHAAGKPLAPEVTFDELAKETPGFSGAELANVINEGAIMAARNSRKHITTEDFEEAVDRVSMGPEKKNRVISLREKEMTAYHEAGHALVAWASEHADKVHKISIIARGATGGHTSIIPDEDRSLWTKDQFNARMAVAMGGRVAEVMKFDTITTGASNDIEQATKLARVMIKKYGMSENLGPRSFGEQHESILFGRPDSEGQDHSDKITEKIDDEIDELLKASYTLAKETIREHEDRLKALAEYLIEYETISGEVMEKIFADPEGYEIEPKQPEDEPENVAESLEGTIDVPEEAQSDVDLDKGDGDISPSPVY